MEKINITSGNGSAYANTRTYKLLLILSIITLVIVVIGTIVYTSRSNSPSNTDIDSIRQKLAQFGTVIGKSDVGVGNLTAWRIVAKNGQTVTLLTTPDGTALISGFNVWDLNSKKNVTPDLTAFDQNSPIGQKQAAAGVASTAIQPQLEEGLSSAANSIGALTGVLTEKYDGVVPESIQTVNSLAGFKEGKGSIADTLYVIIDPRCQYCQRAFALTRPYVAKGYSIKWIPTVALGQPESGNPLAAAILQTKDTSMLERILGNKEKISVTPTQQNITDLAKSLEFMFLAFDQNQQGQAGVPVAFFLDHRTKQPRMMMGLSEQVVLDEIFGKN